MNKVETRIFIALQVVLIIVMAIIAVSLLGSSSIGGFLSGTAGGADNVDSSYVSWLTEQRDEIQALLDELGAEIKARNQEIADITEIIFQMWEGGAAQEDLDIFFVMIDSLMELNKWDLLQYQYLLDQYNEIVFLISMYVEENKQVVEDFVRHYR